jgi:hypothetical protein
MENSPLPGLDQPEPFYYILLNTDGRIESGFQQRDLILNLAQLETLGYKLIPLYRKDNACISPLECIGRTRCLADITPVADQPLIYRLRKRALIRRQIPDRTSARENKRDRVADLLDEAANEIENLRKRLLLL